VLIVLDKGRNSDSKAFISQALLDFMAWFKIIIFKCV
jgi:hypothetical protein